MTRPLRFELADALRHVTSRGEGPEDMQALAEKKPSLVRCGRIGRYIEPSTLHM